MIKIKKIKFILDSSRFVLYFTLGKYLRDRIMCHQTLWWWLPFLYLHPVQLLIWHLYMLTRNKLNSIFPLSSTSLGFLMHLILLSTVETRNYLRHLMVPQPSHSNYRQIFDVYFLNMYQISLLVPTWQHLSTYCNLLPFSAPFSELLKCKSDPSHGPEDI